jgi:hypothetical protein
MTLALRPLALVILHGPVLLVGTLPGKLAHCIAPGLDATQPAMGFLVDPALEEDRRGASQSLQAGRALIALPIIAEFSEQADTPLGSSSSRRKPKSKNNGPWLG